MDINLVDNIAHEDPADTIHNAKPAIEQDGEEYMKRFETVENHCAGLQMISRSLLGQPDQDHRMLAVVDFINKQQKLNEDIYELLVEMNNFFAPRD